MRVAVWLQPTDWVPTSPARRGATPANAIKRWIIRGFLRSGGRVSVILQVNG